MRLQKTFAHTCILVGILVGTLVGILVGILVWECVHLCVCESEFVLWIGVGVDASIFCASII